MRLFLTLLLASAGAALALLFLGSLGQWNPGNPVVAVLIGVVFFVIGISALRGAARLRGPERGGDEAPEEVGDLDVYFVCTECGTEFRVERLGELQVPRHCGEPMAVERRPRAGLT